MSSMLLELPFVKQPASKLLAAIWASTKFGPMLYAEQLHLQAFR